MQGICKHSTGFQGSDSGIHRSTRDSPLLILRDNNTHLELRGQRSRLKIGTCWTFLYDNMKPRRKWHQQKGIKRRRVTSFQKDKDRAVQLLQNLETRAARSPRWKVGKVSGDTAIYRELGGVRHLQEHCCSRAEAHLSTPQLDFPSTDNASEVQQWGKSKCHLAR